MRSQAKAFYKNVVQSPPVRLPPHPKAIAVETLWQESGSGATLIRAHGSQSASGKPTHTAAVGSPIEMDSTRPNQATLAVEALHYGYPALSLLYFIFTSTLGFCTTPAGAKKKDGQSAKRRAHLTLMTLVVGTYAANSVNILIRTLFDRPWAAEQHETVYLVSSFLTWLILTSALVEFELPAWYPHYGASAIAAVSEIALFALSNILSRKYGLFDVIALSIQGVRICALVILLSFYTTLRSRKPFEEEDEERQSLLPDNSAAKSVGNGNANANGVGYGATTNTSETANKNDGNSSDSDEDDVYSKRRNKAQERVKKRLESDGNWWVYVKGFSIFIPHVWPVHDKAMQLRAVALGLVTDALVKGNSPWFAATVYASLTFLNSGSCIGWVQFWLWRPLEQYAEQSLSTASHQHVMSLSSDFHESKDSADIHRAVNQGQSVTKLVEMMIFEVMPMMIDLAAVCIYLNYLFGPYMGLILAVTSLVFIYCTAKLVSLATNKRRQYMKAFRKEWLSVYTSIDNWRTASYFNNIPYEENRYSTNVENRLKREKDYRLGIFLVGAVQIFALTVGLVGACFLAIYQVMLHKRSPGDFVILLTYWAQLRGPLTFFSNAYKKISESLMDAEHLLELFLAKPTVVDREDAQPLVFKKGEVVFDDVHFHYEARKETLRDINFTVPGGSTIALVGETGSGKSTILKLLDRFYDVTDGSIKIDGQDIRDVTVRSLRDKIGVVPQDPDLFNESILNNIRYAKLGSSVEDVHEACKAAAIHEKILSFPDGYQSVVGSHGVRLSGGEKQRIAIARAILKRPEIIVLDEATSAVDSATEQLIQDAFRELCRGRTTFIVAHRLSTIMRADRILVIKDGEIIENGSHDDLIHANGKYTDLWSKQLLVKPGESLSSPGSPKNSDATIVNDVQKQKGTTTLAKALRKTDHSEQECSVASADGPKVKKTKLKPDTPEFVPIRLRTATQDQSPESNGTFGSGILQKTQDQNGSQVYSNGISGAAETNGLSERSGNVGGIDDSRGEKSNAKRPLSRYERRNHTKSDPASYTNGSSNGTETSGSGINSSAPSDPPAGHSQTRSPSRGRPSRRGRHWRLRSKVSRSSALSEQSKSRDGSTEAPPMGLSTMPADRFI
ncbi:hypothetical protein V492_04048 [Pseudogymnoascus sp. VKM F-4246]|nr:hypothetical protein V492_04048 [Pseudogymnoascus sp. VKM F-4246]